MIADGKWTRREREACSDRNSLSAAADPTQARLDVAHTKQAESEGGRQQALKAVQEAWKQIDDLRADVRCGAVPCLCTGRACSHAF